MPAIPEAPSQSDSFEGRPACQEQWKSTWWQMLYEQQPDVGYRRLYYYLMKLVDQAIGRILEALDASGMADDTVVVFTSDHGDMLGVHGGMQQKWCNAYDESVRVPMIVKGPGRRGRERRGHHADQSRRPDPDTPSDSRASTPNAPPKASPSITPRPSRSPAGTSAGSSPDPRLRNRSRHLCIS